MIRDSVADAPGYDARRRLTELEAQVARLAQLEALVELQKRLLRQAADRLDALERRAPGPEVPRRMFAIRAASERSGLSVRSLKRLVQRGDLAGRAAPVTGGQRRCWLVDADSLEAFLSTPAANASAPPSSRARCRRAAAPSRTEPTVGPPAPERPARGPAR